MISKLSAARLVFTLPVDLTYSTAELWIANYPVDPSEDIHSIPLGSYEVRVYRLKEG